MVLHDFYVGKAFDAYDYFGAHFEEDGVVFRVYAPNAKKVELIGDFNGWDGSEDEMERFGDYGIFILKKKNIRSGVMYKYRIYQEDERTVDRFDPYGFGSELRPKTASLVVDLDQYEFDDKDWMKNRSKNFDRPMNIYEVHAGSWRRNEDDENGWYRYNELAVLLADYVKEMGYTHVEFLPLSEHPADCSWGYQVSGFFCPTSRYGTAVELKEMVDIFHKAGIGVIMDFVPIHFVINDYALSNFDGTALYEYPSEDTGYSEWGTCNFNFYRGEVRSFLQSAADFWLTEFHFDGIRMDAISNAIYWMGNEQRGVNEGAVEFIQGMNSGLQLRHPSAMLIAEDSTNYPKVTAPVEYDGLGFDYKWDMGWMNDTLAYFKIHPYDRRYDYHKLSFSMMYFPTEHFMMPLSHDEVVHGKATIIQKMYGDYDIKFQQVKTLYAYMYTHPGKKLNFMGNEIGQFREWDEEKECDWFLLKYPKHDDIRRFIKDLNHLYINTPALYEGEYNPNYFRWLEINAPDDCVYIYERMSKKTDSYITVLNTGNDQHNDYVFNYDKNAVLHEVLCGERQEYGGYYDGPKKPISSKKTKDGWTFTVTIPALAAVIYRVELVKEQREETISVQKSRKKKKKKGTSHSDKAVTESDGSIQ